MSIIITGTADQIGELLHGPRQHNEHCKAWRWHRYVTDARYAERAAAVKAAQQRLADQHRLRRMSSQQWADGLLAEYWAERS